MVSVTAKKEKVSSVTKLAQGVWSEEIMVFCPRCKVLESVWISNGMLMPTRKFRQTGTQIYHDCGSSQPCRIYHDW